MAFAQANLDYGSIEYVSDLHHRHNGGITFAQIIEGDWEQTKALPYNNAIIKAKELKGFDDVYMAINAVGQYQPRTIEGTCYLTANFIDADFYKLGLSFDDAFTSLLSHCESEKIPFPTKVIDSGRGLYALWVFPKPVYCGHKSKDQSKLKGAWAYTQNNLIKSFKDIGADPACKDSSRVLRLVSSVNSKSSRPVMAYSIGDRIDPIKLTKSLLQTPAYSKQIDTSVKKKTSEVNYKVSRTVTKLLTPYSLCMARMQDFRKLAEIRGGELTDHRAMAIFYYACCVSWYAGTKENLLRLVSNFMGSCIKTNSKYDFRQPEKHVKTVLDRFDKSVNSDHNSPDNFNYKLRTSTIIKTLEITEAEQVHMSTLIGGNEKKRRKAEANREMRRAKGVLVRSEFEAERSVKIESKIEASKRLRNEGLTIKAIAEKLNISVRTVNYYLVIK